MNNAYIGAQSIKIKRNILAVWSPRGSWWLLHNSNSPVLETSGTAANSGDGPASRETKEFWGCAAMRRPKVAGRRKVPSAFKV